MVLSDIIGGNGTKTVCILSGIDLFIIQAGVLWPVGRGRGFAKSELSNNKLSSPRRKGLMEKESIVLQGKYVGKIITNQACGKPIDKVYWMILPQNLFFLIPITSAAFLKVQVLHPPPPPPPQKKKKKGKKKVIDFR